MTLPIRCGVIGFGLAGRIFHAAVIDATEGLTLAAIVQRSGDDAKQAYPSVPVYRSVEALLAEGNVDVVVVATPNQTHARLAEQCLRAGKHVVVDKPAAVSSSETASLLKISQQTGRRVFVYHNRRWDGDFITIQQLLQGGRLGTLRTFESHFDRFRPAPKPNAWREEPEPGAGILLDLGSHLVDQALVLFGLPTAVWGDVRNERTGSRVDDTFDLRLYYRDLTVWLRSSSLAYLPAVRFLAYGTSASYRKDNLDPQEDALRAGDLFRSSPWGVDPESAWGTIMTLGADNAVQHTKIPTLPGDYRGFYRNVRDTLLGTESQAVTLVDAWRTLRLLEWTRASSEQRAAVTCDWSDAPQL
ncbi:MAG: oxidoreductase, NAD-binding [Acidobacteriaceae bacterium]|nr:oxidoreductase, NAD-binding [Acidobacteriaceae bacterium]